MSGTRHFACTQCGACCNRSPEVELSEAAPLADVFVWRLMFRLYTLPRSFEDSGSGDAALFYEKKRLLAAHAAHQFARKVHRGGRRAEVTHYLMISALALDGGRGMCAALHARRCSIHERRPLGCRTVPFHYSRPDSLAVSDFDAFVSTPGYCCDTSEVAPMFVNEGRVLEFETLQTRAEALATATRDRRWKEAIVRKMKQRADGLPSLEGIEANAQHAAVTTSMRIGWQIACEAGLMSPDTYRSAPIYAYVAGSSVFEAPLVDIALQAIVQGFLTGIVALLLYGRMVAILGATRGAAFLALTPAVTALMGIPILGEFPLVIDWSAVVVISIGVYIVSGGPLPGKIARFQFSDARPQ